MNSKASDYGMAAISAFMGVVFLFGGASFGNPVGLILGLAMIGGAVEEKVADVVEEGTLPQVVVGKLAESFEGGNVERVIPQAVGGPFGPAPVAPAPMRIER